MKVIPTLLSIVAATHSANGSPRFRAAVCDDDNSVRDMTYTEFTSTLNKDFDQKMIEVADAIQKSKLIKETEAIYKVSKDEILSLKLIISRHFYNSFCKTTLSLLTSGFDREYPRTVHGARTALSNTKILKLKELNLSNEANLYHSNAHTGNLPHLSVLRRLNSLRFFKSMETLHLNNMRITNELLKEILPNILVARKIFLVGNLITRIPDFPLGLGFRHIPIQLIFYKNPINITLPGSINGCTDVTIKLDDRNFDEADKQILMSKFKSVVFGGRQSGMSDTNPNVSILEELVSANENGGRRYWGLNRTI